MGRIFWYGLLIIATSLKSYAQVDTSFVYNNSTPYGSLDIRIANSPTWYYYLQENKTFSFRESPPGVKTNTYLDMTSWESSPYTQGNLRMKNGSDDSFVMNYRLLPPQNYNASYSPGYPLILSFHGAREGGNCWDEKCFHATRDYSPVTNSPAAPTDPNSELLNNDQQLVNGGSVHMKAVKDAAGKLPDDATLAPRAFPGFVLFPQNLNGWEPESVQDAIRIVRLICKKYNIDQNRIYIEGLSNGGHGLYEATKRAPWMFAAAIAMSAIDDGYVNSQKLAPTIAHIPLWAFQGGQDINPYPHKTENFLKQFKDAGAEVRYTLYPELGHGTWGTAYGEPDFFSWMLKKNRANIHVFAGNATICEAGLKLELPEGFRAYQWQLNGTVISGATAASYTATMPGLYKARFARVTNPTESQWNKWSDAVDVKVGQPIPQAVIKQIGTVLLKDLNNNADARLEGVGNYDHYYWYKDGQLINFPGEQDDTIKHPIINPTMGKGVYTLITSNFDNCQSPVSAGKYIFFNNQAPLVITSPGNFAANVNEASEVALSWTDASNNENGFEIWRRRKIDASTFSPWVMVTLTEANVSSFKDTRLLPSSTFQYMIRAVSNSGRSNYSPSGGTVEIVTGPDKQIPSAPKNLVASVAGVKKIKLIWVHSTDNIALKEYVIYYGSDSLSTGNTDTTYLFTDLALNKLFTFKVKAKDVSGNLSLPSNSRQGSTYLMGLFYEHSTGIALDLDSVNWDKPEFTGIVPTFTLQPKTQDDFFNFRFDGFVLIAKDGSYQFRTSSDDGSRLRLDNNLIVDNDGVHQLKTVTSGVQTLKAGPHRITVDFFDYIQTDTLVVEYKGPDTNNNWMVMPAAVLKSNETIITGLDPDNGPEDSFIVDIFPNPSTQDNINLKIQTVINAPINIQLIDAIGRRLATETISPEQLAESIKLSPAENLVSGIYIVIVRQGNTTVRQRVIIKN